MLVERPLAAPHRPARFDRQTREELTRALRRARPRPDVAAIIGGLEQAREVVVVMRTDARDAESLRAALNLVAGIAGRLRTALGAARVEADDLIAGALAQLHYAPDLLDRLAEGLDMLVEVLEAAQPPSRRAARPRGAGRAPGVAAGITTWLAAEVARILEAHDVRATRHRDGVWADILRALWPPLVGTEAPTEIQRLLRSVPARRR